MSALRFFYWKTLKRRDLHFDDLPMPQEPMKLPVVLDPGEVTQLIEGASSLKDRTRLMILYGTGIRRSELRLLKVTDIDSKRMVIHIRQGKGRRDRDLPMTPKLLEALREYWRSGGLPSYSERLSPPGGCRTLIDNHFFKGNSAVQPNLDACGREYHSASRPQCLHAGRWAEVVPPDTREIAHLRQQTTPRAFAPG
jgi:integrase